MQCWLVIGAPSTSSDELTCVRGPCRAREQLKESALEHKARSTRALCGRQSGAKDVEWFCRGWEAERKRQILAVEMDSCRG